MTWDQLNGLKVKMISLRNRSSRLVILALIQFLFKPRTENSNKIISSVFQLDNEQSISDYGASVIKSFETDMSPFHFSLSALNRDDLINNHTTEITRKLFDGSDHLFIICDGMYARHQKNTNKEYQRKSFSGQKEVPLCKPFTICTNDCFAIDMLGSYPANKNDAEILKNSLEDSNGLRNFFKEGDTFVLYRGYSDIVCNLEETKFKVLMPALNGKGRQLTAEESHQPRFITKIRFLDHKIDNKLLSKVRIYFRIASFLNNTFRRRLLSDVEVLDEVVQRIHTQKSIENTLAIEAEKEGWFRKELSF